MTELWIVRHGCTELNEKNILHGSLDPPLSPKGVMQAFELAGKIRLSQLGLLEGLDGENPLSYPRRVDLIYSSPLLRARQTAEILCQNGEEIIIDPRLRERSVGEYEGVTPHKLKHEFPRSFLKELHFFDTQPPGGESIRQTQDRTSELIEEVKEKHPGKSLLVVTHCITAQTMYYHANPQIKDRAFYIYALKNCGVMPLKI